MASKREVWEAAKAANLDGFIESVSRIFNDNGKSAIDAVMIEHNGVKVGTDEKIMHNPVRVIPGMGVASQESKDIIDRTRRQIKRLK